jgi:hypothetical protein
MSNDSKYWDEISRLPIGCTLEIKVGFEKERYLFGNVVLTDVFQPSPENCNVGTIYFKGILREDGLEETYSISKIVLYDGFFPFTKALKVEFYENRTWGSTYQDGKLASYSVCD